MRIVVPERVLKAIVDILDSPRRVSTTTSRALARTVRALPARKLSPPSGNSRSPLISFGYILTFVAMICACVSPVSAQSIVREAELDLDAATRSVAAFFRNGCGRGAAVESDEDQTLNLDLVFAGYSLTVTGKEKSGSLHAALPLFLGSYSASLDYRWKTSGKRQVYSYLPQVELTDSLFAFDDTSGIRVTVDPELVRSVRPVIIQRLYLYRTLALPAPLRPGWNLSAAVPAAIRVFGKHVDSLQTVASEFARCLAEFSAGKIVYAGPLSITASNSLLETSFYCILLDPNTTRHHLLTIREEFTTGQTSWQQTKLTCDLHPYIRTDNVKSLTGTVSDPNRPKIPISLPIR